LTDNQEVERNPFWVGVLESESLPAHYPFLWLVHEARIAKRNI